MLLLVGCCVHPVFASELWPLPKSLAKVRPDHPLVLSGEALHVARDPTCRTDPDLLLDTSPWTPAGAYWSYGGDTCYLAAFALRTGAQARAFVLEVGYHHGLLAWVWRDGELVDTLRAGNGLPLARRAFPHVTAEAPRNLLPLTLAPNSEYRILISYHNPLGESIYATNTAQVVRVRDAEEITLTRGRHLAFANGLLGALLALLAFQLARLTTARSRITATFCVVLATMAAFTAFDYGILHGALRSIEVPTYLVYLLGGTGLAALAAFARAVFRETDPVRVTDRTLYALTIGLTAAGALPFASYWLADLDVPVPAGFLAAAPMAFRVAVVLGLLALVGVLTFHAWRRGLLAIRIIVAGLAALALLVVANVTQAVLEPYAGFAPVGAYLRAIRPVFPYLIGSGIVVMCLCFAVAVGLLDRDRERRRERAYHLRLTEAEMGALRARMNPHFLFNGLNSIKGYVIDNDREAAASYLSKFARLIRRVLEQSGESLVPLADELETLRLYLDLERQRANTSFAVDAAVADEVDAEGVMIPPLLLQPYAENAVWHGLRHRGEPGGRITVRVGRGEKARETLIVIRDNGVGRAAARELASPGSRHRSRGMRLTGERVDLLREVHGIAIALEIVDLYTPDGRAEGTEVLVRLADAAVEA